MKVDWIDEAAQLFPKPASLLLKQTETLDYPLCLPEGEAISSVSGEYGCHNDQKSVSLGIPCFPWLRDQTKVSGDIGHGGDTRDLFQLTQVDPSRPSSREATLAYYINTYNALTLW
jgi:hypothetical protein